MEKLKALLRKSLAMTLSRGRKATEVLSRDEGQDMIEYAVLGAFISIAAIAIIKVIGPLLVTIFTNIQAALT